MAQALIRGFVGVVGLGIVVGVLSPIYQVYYNVSTANATELLDVILTINLGVKVALVSILIAIILWIFVYATKKENTSGPVIP